MLWIKPRPSALQNTMKLNENNRETVMTETTEEAIIFDTETHSKDNPIIIEAAWIGAQTGSKYCQRFNPGVPITFGAMAVHHIRDEEVADKPPASTFKLPDSVKFLIGHNIDFDWGAIGQPDVKRICTLALARTYLPDLDSHTQSALMYYFFGADAKPLLRDAHSALADVTNLTMVLERMLESVLPSCEDFDSLWRLSEEARIPKKWAFGKHYGTPIAETPYSYRKWYLGTDDPDPYYVKALNRI